MEFVYIIAALAAAAVLTGAFYLLKKKNKCITIPTRIAAVLLIAVAFLRYMWEHEAIYYVRGLNMFSPFGADIPSTIFAIILVWFTYATLMSIVMSCFYSFPTLKHITRFFATPILLLDLVFFRTYATAIVGPDPFSQFDARLVFVAIEIALALSLVASDMLIKKPSLPTKKEWITFSYALPASIIVMMPSYVLQALLGFRHTQDLQFYDITEEHRLVLYFSIILPFVIFHVLKDRSEDVKRFCMIYLSFASLWIYLSYYTLSAWADPLNWPLHLCNTAMFLIPLCLTLKLNRLFYFCLFINVMGALLAMLMPNTSEAVNAIGTERVIFWVNHYIAFFMPVLLVALKLFNRPKFKEWVYALSAFCVYFVLMLIINAWFSNYGDVDYFFLNSDFIVDKLGKWAEDTRLFTVSFNINELVFVFYPIYQLLFFIVYVAITAGVWFLYEILFTSWDHAEDRRLRERDYKRMKKELKNFLGGKPTNEPVSGDDSPCIELKEFSKKYGANTHYSVDHASFKVRGGEIFGFLGPNGAGKSTIIKSMVGIQTITSGNIEICGYDVEKQPVDAKLNTGFVPDHYALYENLTGREYINYIADLYSVSQEYRDETIEYYVNLFQLTGSFDNQMKTYSHGMKQKIAIMAALVHNPKVWILDEPLTGLDPTSIHEVKECMKHHAAKGNIVFFSSHIIDVVEKICDKIAIIKKGKIRAAATVAELDARGIDLEQFYLDIINSEEDAPVISINGDDILGIGGNTPDGAAAAGAEEV